MKKKLKTFARALSPFNSKLQEKHNEKNPNDYFWNLANTNIEQVLIDFYSIHNPERIQNVKTIVREYQGEEIKMLQQLCARYSISEANMQVYIDNAKQNLNVNNAQSMNLSSDKKAFSHMNNIEEKKFHNSNEIYSDYSWNLSGVDIAAALQLIYKENNPTKVPNVASLSTKSHSELILILQQLGKRHELDHSEIQDYLDRSTLKTTSDLHIQQSKPYFASKVSSKSVNFPKTEDQHSIERISKVNDNKSSNDTQRVKSKTATSLQLSNNEKQSITATLPANSESPKSKPHSSNIPSTSSSLDQVKSAMNKPHTHDSESVDGSLLFCEEEKATSNVLSAKLKLQQSKTQKTDNASFEFQAKYETLLELYKQKEFEHERETSTQKTIMKSHEDRSLHLENELKDMKHILLNTEKRREDIFNEHNTLKEDYAYLETKLNEAETKCSNALLDRKDLLRLIDIMSSSPVAIKTVLEAYLSKLGETTGSSAVKHGIGSDGQQLPISHRISIALSIKRGGQDVSASFTESFHDSNSSSNSHDNLKAINHGLSEQERHSFDTLKSNIKKKGKDSPNNSINGLKGSQLDEAQPITNTAEGTTTHINHKIMTEQYDLAKKYFKQQEQQEKLAQKIHASNLNIKEMQTNDVIGNSLSKDQANMVLTSNNGDIANDWIECTDPRTKRKYYYSASLKKSSWTKPYNFNNEINKPTKLISIASNRYESPNTGIRASVNAHTADTVEMNNVKQHFKMNTSSTPFKIEELTTTDSTASILSRSDMASSPNSAVRTTEEYNSMFFATRGITSTGTSLVNSKWNRSATTSPAPSIAASSYRSSSPTHSHNSSSRNKTKHHSNEKSSSVWVVAIDPNTKRKYWYNRQTKVSTWRQPVELLM